LGERVLQHHSRDVLVRQQVLLVMHFDVVPGPDKLAVFTVFFANYARDRGDEWLGERLHLLVHLRDLAFPLLPLGGGWLKGVGFGRVH
jgi:hypothetical protein